MSSNRKDNKNEVRVELKYCEHCGGFCNKEKGRFAPPLTPERHLGVHLLTGEPPCPQRSSRDLSADLFIWVTRRDVTEDQTDFVNLRLPDTRVSLLVRTNSKEDFVYAGDLAIDVDVLFVRTGATSTISPLLAASIPAWTVG